MLKVMGYMCPSVPSASSRSFQTSSMPQPSRYRNARLPTGLAVHVAEPHDVPPFVHAVTVRFVTVREDAKIRQPDAQRVAKRVLQIQGSRAVKAHNGTTHSHAGGGTVQSNRPAFGTVRDGALFK